MRTLLCPADSHKRTLSANTRPALVRRSPDPPGHIAFGLIRPRAVTKRLVGSGPSRLLLLTVGLVVFTVAGLPARAQDSPAAKSAEASGDDKAEERAYSLLDDVIVKAQALKLP
jgi:hypothetical protein